MMVGMAKRSAVGELIWERRVALGIRSQQRLADLVGVDRSHIAKIESGVIALPQPDLRRRLGEVLGLREMDFLMAAGWVQEEPTAYETTSGPDEHRLRSIIRSLPDDDRTLVVEFAELLARRRREQSE